MTGLPAEAAEAAGAATRAASADSYFLHPLDHLALTIAVVLVVGVLAIVIPLLVGRRREAAVDAVASGDRLRREPGATWAVDRALRVLVDACRQQGTRFPGAVTVTLGPASVSAALARPTVAPPAPFLTPPDGRVWSAPWDAVQRFPLDDVIGDEFATAVAIGSGDAGLVVVDLRRTHGVVAVDGDRAARRAVARRVVDQVVTNPWSASTEVLTVGLRDGEVAAGRSVSVGDAITAVRENRTPGVLVMTRIPSGDDGTELLRALEDPANRWGVVALQPSEDARWSMTAHRDGRLTSEVLGELRWVDVLLSNGGVVPAAAPESVQAAR